MTGVRGIPDSSERVRDRYRPGEVIDKYRLVRLLGEGGMGTVWVAHDSVLDVHVAVKLINLEASTDEARKLTQRLLDEARSAARLGHGSIVRVHDFGQTSHGDPFIAMELLDGEDLATVLERDTRLPALQAVQVLLPIAHALSAAHEKSIVHRDVKPENIFLGKADVGVVPKLLDFGIARRVDNPRKLTLEGSVLGTPDYMSPEQARGAPAGPQTDLWSFCVVLYELVSGVCPFQGPNYNALLRRIIEEPPQPLVSHGVGDEELGSIIERGLHKEPTDRWSSMHELGEALAQWLLHRGIGEDITGQSLRHTWLRDETGARFDISQIAQLAQVGAGSGVMPASSRAASGQQRTTGSGPARINTGNGAASETSEPDLQAIAELNRGGDPVELLERAQRRKTLQLAIVMLLLVSAAVVGILTSTGIIRLR